MSILDTLGTMMESSGTSAKSDIERINRIKKMLNLKENESIKSVPEAKLHKFVECYGKTASEGLKRYAAISEDATEKKRIAKVLAVLGL
jgi:hypothetical protein